MSKTYYVYILRCRDGSYYTGITNDFERRLEEHQAGTDGKCYTTRRRPVKLVYRSEFQDVGEAIRWEKIVKGWSRGKKEALINGEYEALPLLSICPNGSNCMFYKNIACHAERSRSVIYSILNVSIPRLRSGRHICAFNNTTPTFSVTHAPSPSFPHFGG